jgi:hypothetical protein
MGLQPSTGVWHSNQLLNLIYGQNGENMKGFLSISFSLPHIKSPTASTFALHLNHNLLVAAGISFHYTIRVTIFLLHAFVSSSCYFTLLRCCILAHAHFM